MLNLHESELAGKFVHTGGRAVTTLETAQTEDPSPVVRKKAGLFTPGGTIYQRTSHARPGNGTAVNRPPVNGHGYSAGLAEPVSAALVRPVGAGRR